MDMSEVHAVKEIRASLSDQNHRLLKEEAARKSVPLKKLIANVLEEHIKQEKGERNGNTK